MVVARLRRSQASSVAAKVLVGAEVAVIARTAILRRFDAAHLGGAGADLTGVGGGAALFRGDAPPPFAGPLIRAFIAVIAAASLEFKHIAGAVCVAGLRGAGVAIGAILVRAASRAGSDFDVLAHAFAARIDRTWVAVLAVLLT